MLGKQVPAVVSQTIDALRLRDTVGRAQAAGRAGSARRRGLRHGAAFGAAALPFGPEAAPGRLERYFDGHTEGPGIWKWRHYFPIYERHLAKFVGNAPRIVEIGIFSGGSLRMWLDYFGAGTHVHGVDIQPACRSHQSPDVSVSIGDQADPGFWKAFLDDVPPIDIVIDDGGHHAEQQIPTLEALLPHIRPGGVYVCEDIHGRHHPFHAYIDGLSRNLHAVGPGRMDDGHVATPLQQAVESIHRYPFVTVIERRNERLARFVAPKHGSEWEPSFYEAQEFPGAAPGEA